MAAWICLTLYYEGGVLYGLWLADGINKSSSVWAAAGGGVEPG
jgi:hypothetical protein